jgi:hypothetical protein
VVRLGRDRDDPPGPEEVGMSALGDAVRVRRVERRLGQEQAAAG